MKTIDPHPQKHARAPEHATTRYSYDDPLLSQPRLPQPRLPRPRLSHPLLSRPRLSQPLLSQPLLSQPLLSQPATLTTRYSHDPQLSLPLLSRPGILTSRDRKGAVGRDTRTTACLPVCEKIRGHCGVALGTPSAPTCGSSVPAFFHSPVREL